MKYLLAAATLLLTPTPASRESVTLEFGWPATGRCEILERVDKKGDRASMRYALSWSPLADDDVEDGISISYVDFRFVSLEGIDANHPSLAPHMPRLNALSSAIPSMRVDGRGNLIGFEGMEELVRAIVADFGDDQRAVAEEVAQVLRDEQFIGLMEANVSEIWNNWVGHWVDCEVERGTQELWELDMELTGGVIPELQLTYGELVEHRGVACVEIEMLGEADGGALRAQLMEIMGPIAESAGRSFTEEMLELAEKEVIVSGVFAVEGLRPLQVVTSELSRIRVRGEGVQTQSEEHEYFFDWPGVEPHGEQR